MKLEQFARIIVLCIWTGWVCLTMIFLLSGEEIFILPALFAAFALNQVLFSFSRHIPMLRIVRSLLWYICFMLFAYLSAGSTQAKPFFPLLCLVSALSGLCRPFQGSKSYGTLLFSTWLICIGAAFYFGIWPAGCIFGVISLFISVILFIKQQQAAQLVQKSQQPVAEAHEHEEPAPSTLPAFQIPGQQYQPLLPEYDTSYGPYLQDLPRDK
jgi:hypothetical protein